MTYCVSETDDAACMVCIQEWNPGHEDVAKKEKKILEALRDEFVHFDTNSVTKSEISLQGYKGLQMVGKNTRTGIAYNGTWRCYLVPPDRMYQVFAMSKVDAGYYADGERFLKSFRFTQQRESSAATPDRP